jgi:hypothetical protein
MTPRMVEQRYNQAYLKQGEYRLLTLLELLLPSWAWHPVSREPLFAYHLEEQ